MLRSTEYACQEDCCATLRHSAPLFPIFYVTLLVILAPHSQDTYVFVGRTISLAARTLLNQGRTERSDVAVLGHEVDVSKKPGAQAPRQAEQARPHHYSLSTPFFWHEGGRFLRSGLPTALHVVA